MGICHFNIKIYFYSSTINDVFWFRITVKSDPPAVLTGCWRVLLCFDYLHKIMDSADFYDFLSFLKEDSENIPHAVGIPLVGLSFWQSGAAEGTFSLLVCINLYGIQWHRDHCNWIPHSCKQFPGRNSIPHRFTQRLDGHGSTQKGLYQKVRLLCHQVRLYPHQIYP